MKPGIKILVDDAPYFAYYDPEHNCAWLDVVDSSGNRNRLMSIQYMDSNIQVHLNSIHLEISRHRRFFELLISQIHET